MLLGTIQVLAKEAKMAEAGPTGGEVWGGEAEDILRSYRAVAVVGASSSPERDSYQVVKYLKEHGYRVFPVNPAASEVVGERCYPDLASIPERVEVVDVFRRNEAVPAIAEEAITIGAKALWLQLGVINEEAAGKAREAGLRVVMDRCMKQEHRRLFGAGPDS